MLFAACGEKDITPSVNNESEYNYLLELTPNSTPVDRTIAEWFKKYDCAVLYKFEEKDFRWLWSERINYYYEPIEFNSEEDEDYKALENMVGYIEKYLITGKAESVLKKTLPYKIFLTKEMHQRDYKESAYLNSIYNGQDAILLGYMQSEEKPFDEISFAANLNAVYMSLVYNALEPKPKEFVESREKCDVIGKNEWITMPSNPAIEDEPEWDPEVYPDFLNPDENGQIPTNPDSYYHNANVLGYIYSYGATPGSAPLYAPDEATDYSDYYSFITNQSGSYIRARTQYYWRIAKRASLLIEYCKNKGEDLIAIQNASVPNDPVRLEDFAYEERY